ncbi:response regulator [Vreelandella profundi]|uniref:response regulator n=1 Tax=Vreelandella profundi TaxID=2852117 RepID=UPI001EF1256C|nr:response regulator [Halomonas profundi]
MTQRYQREHFWGAIIWPLLWPLFFLQAALILLCLAVAAMVWWMSPSYVSWSTMLWLALAMLIGSSLNVGAFLMLIKTRARRKDSHFMQELAELERHGQALYATASRSLPEQRCAPLKAADESQLPLQRLASVNVVLADIERCIVCSQTAGAAAKQTQQEHEQSLLDDIQQQQRQLKHLTTGRERAREESRLKSGYLALLQNETDKLFEYLNAMAEQDLTNGCRQRVLDVRERLSDIRSLLDNLAHHNADKNSDQQRDRSVLQDDASQRHLRVLVVDDGPVNLMLARQMLEAQGLQVESVSSGEEALERQRSAMFDLVFMDIFMPTLDGLETTRRWRDYERTHDCGKSVLVALTANGDNAGRDACLAAGMDDLLAKPYQPETLLNIIVHWFPDTVEADAPA